MTAKGRRKAEASASTPTVNPDLWRLILADRWPTVSGPGFLLVHGDCLDVLAAMPARSCAVVLTDPPYEAEAHTEQRRQKGKVRGPANVDAWRSVDEAPLAFAAITPADRSAVAGHIARVAAHRAIACCQAEAVAAWRDAFNEGGMPYRRAIPWVKPDAMPSLHGRYPGQSFESIVLAQHASSPAAPVGGKARAYEFTRARAGQPGGPGGTQAPHPTTKPLPLMLAMVEDFTEAGDLVVDPYCGSATTGIACIQRGRLFVGIEKDAEFFAVACRRMRGEEAKPKECQPQLFAAIGGS